MGRCRSPGSSRSDSRYSRDRLIEPPAPRDTELATASWRSGLVGIALQQLRVGREIFGVRLPPDVVAQRSLKSAVGARHHLDPEVAHLVRRVLAPDDARGRMMRIARVVGGVVVDVAHRDRRALRQRERRRVAIDVLPAEIPVGDRDQPVAWCRPAASASPPSAARGCARAAAPARTSTSTGSCVAVGDDVLALARRDVDRLAAEPQADRRARRRRVGEVEADDHLQRLRLCRSAAGAAARRDRCPARGATACRRATGAAPGPASTRAAALPDSARRAPCCRRSRARDRARRAVATTACDRRRGWRDGRRARCRAGTRSRARSARAATGIGITKVRNTSAPSARHGVRPRGMRTTRSGVPSCQPSFQLGGGGRSRGVAFRCAARDPLAESTRARAVGRAAARPESRPSPALGLPRRHDPPRA